MTTDTPEVWVPDLSEATVYIVGGTSGVGLQVARQLVRAGTQRIGLVGRNTERGEKAAAEIRTLASGVWAFFAAGDVNDPAEAARVTEELSASLGPADILINSTVSAFTPQLFHDTLPEDVPAILLQQALGPINMCRTVLPHMRAKHGGAIVNIASDAAKHPTPGESVIGAAMAAIVMFSKTLAMEAKRDGIRINAVTPSLIRDTAPTTVSWPSRSAPSSSRRPPDWRHWGSPSRSTWRTSCCFCAALRPVGSPGKRSARMVASRQGEGSSAAPQLVHTILTDS